MKKSLLALAVLASAAGAAQAATSVALYGRVDAGYQKFTNNKFEDISGKEGTNLTQEGGNESRLGVKGQEDLGHGLAATFQLEGRFNADTGKYNSRFFHRESTVGLKGAFGHVRLGRSKSAMERALGDFAPGERVTTIWDPYSSATRHDNSAFYDFSYAGLNIGGNVTTRSGASEDGTIATKEIEENYEKIAGVTPEGTKHTRVSYGLHASYNGKINDRNSYSVAAALQQDTRGLTFGGTTRVLATREWGIGAQYNFNPIGIGGTYADLKTKADIEKGGVKLRTWSAYITADITPNDAVYVKYMSRYGKFLSDSEVYADAKKGMKYRKEDMWGLGYKHDLSKRTSVYFDVARYTNKVAYNNPTKTKTTGFDVALRHAF